MALIERALESRFLHPRARREARALVQPAPEVPPQPFFSEGFLTQQQLQSDRDTRMSQLVATGPATHLGFGQDRDVSVLPTTTGEVVIKTLKTDSRPHMVFGMGISPRDIPRDDDTTGAREALVARYSHVDVDLQVVAEKLRLTHVLAATYLDRGDRLILPTATLVSDDSVVDIQKYLPRICPPSMERDSREVAIEVKAKDKLFSTLRERWKEMLTTPDFRNMPDDVQAYWRKFPPDSGYGTNAVFLGIDRVVAIDY